jgi:5-methylcytosine-specific restriction protein A
MATAPLRPCATPKCNTLTPNGRCGSCARKRDRQRPNVDVRRLYHTARWRKLRALVLQEEPLCCDCMNENQVIASTDVDHEVPHRGDLELFWSRANLRGRCHECHSRKTQRGE